MHTSSRDRGASRTRSTSRWSVDGGDEVSVTGTGNGPIDAFVDALSTRGYDVRVLDYAEHALDPATTRRPRRTSSAGRQRDKGDRVFWGVGVDPNIVTASLRAVICAINRAG